MININVIEKEDLNKLFLDYKESNEVKINSTLSEPDLIAEEFFKKVYPFLLFVKNTTTNQTLKNKVVDLLSNPLMETLKTKSQKLSEMKSIPLYFGQTKKKQMIAGLINEISDFQEWFVLVGVISVNDLDLANLNKHTFKK
jgi:hypothetical protein